MAKNLTADELREILDYCPETGVFRWKIRPSRRVYAGDVAGAVKATGYREVCFKKRSYLEHRLAWLYVYGEWPKGVIDHVNHRFDDNRIANLREATWAENSWNRRTQSKNGAKGVYFRRNGWETSIMKDGKYHYLGRFRTREDAVEAHRKAALALHGAFALPEV